MSSEVSVVLVNYRSAADTEAAVAALGAAEPGLALEVIVVDNASGEEDRRRLARVPAVTLVENPENVGFARASNRGAELAQAPFLLLLNPDVRLTPGALGALLAAARRHPEAAVFAPRLVNPDGSPQRNARRFYRWRTVLVRRSPLARWLGSTAENAAHLYAEVDPRASLEVDWAMGAALLVRREDFNRLGGFDPRFFLYFEDVDLCLRAWRAGRAVRYVGEAVMVHAHRRASARGGLSRAKREHLRSMRYFHAKHGGWPRRELLLPGAPLVFVNQGQGAMGERARRFAAALGGGVLAKDAMPGSRAGRALGAAATVIRLRPRHLHVIDVGVAGLLAAAAARLARSRVVLDTGDEYHDLMRRTARLPGPALPLAGAVEALALGLADVVVARGRGHVAALHARGYNDVRWIPDGVEVERCRAAAPHPWRVERGWEGFLVAASVGSLLVDERYHVTQGSDLIEALPHAPEVRAAIVGDGPGLEMLRSRARALGVSARVAFLGRVTPEELPSRLRSFDVCISTQTDDPVGHARTTGKLPLFLACGRYVLATAVGEAARVLPPEMLLPYRGEHDPGHPRRLGERLLALDRDRTPLRLGDALPAIAERLFDYRPLAAAAAALALPGAER